jgi:tight adherence protein B
VTTEPAIATALLAAAFGLAGCAMKVGGGSAITNAGRGRGVKSLRHSLARGRAVWAAVSHDGGSSLGEARRRLWIGGCAAGAVLGFSLLGAPGLLLGAVAGPYGVRVMLRSRRDRFAARIDECAPEFALALASALAGGNSVRGALLASARATPEPLAGELDRACIDLTLGRSVEDALVSLRTRTASARVESLAGAIGLHRSSGGDLVRLMRELAAAFRTRDIVRRDAKTATAQARFTAIVVAAIPLTLGLVAELVSPGSVSGVFAFAPTALLMVLALILLFAGCAMCARVGKVA